MSQDDGSNSIRIKKKKSQGWSDERSDLVRSYSDIFFRKCRYLKGGKYTDANVMNNVLKDKTSQPN